MAIFKCKMCGGVLEIVEGMSVCQCAYCGTTQTLPKLRDDRQANLYDRAHQLRLNNEFDKAAAIYEQILAEDNTDAEAYWSLVLCTYGVIYVENPIDRKRTPTVNKVQYTSIFDDVNYQGALRYANPMQYDVYRAEAAAINEIQKGILATSQRETPYDVFICYKESDAQGNRTLDSVLGQEMYNELTRLGYKVFFARITLEDKLGVEYEPYIFSALNSAKVMVAIATKPEYANAPWVKNEWSRYLAMIKAGQRKTLIPAYRDMSVYELPTEFAHLQAQDMNKLGFMQDLVRGIEKIIGRQEEAPKATVAAPVAAAVSHSPVDPLLKRIRIFLGDGAFADAAEYCNKVLDMDPENGMAYVYQLLAHLKCASIEALQNQAVPFDNIPAYRHALRYVDTATAERLTAANNMVKNRIAQKRMQQQQWQQQQQQNQWEYEQQRKQQEQQKYQQWQQQQQYLQLQQQQISELEKKRSKRIGWGILFLVLAYTWPIGVGLLISAGNLKKKIQDLKKNTYR